MDCFNLAISRGPYVLFLPDIFIEDLKIQPGSFLSSLEENVSEPINFDDMIEDDEFDGMIDMQDMQYTQDMYDLGIQNVTSINDLDITLQNHVVKQSVSIKNRVPLPEMYYSLDNWPETTNLECWACGNIPPGRPWSIPKSIIKMAMRTLQKTKYEDEIIDPSSLGDETVLLENTKIKQVSAKKMHGVFCHVFCIGRHIKFSDDPIVKENEWQCIECTKDLFYEWEGKKLIELPISTHPWSMAKHSGKPDGLTEQEYYDQNVMHLSTYISY